MTSLKLQQLHWKKIIIPKIAEILFDRYHNQKIQTTIRGIFYILVSLEIIENLQQRYGGLSKALVRARENGTINEHWISDNSRRIIDIEDEYQWPSERIQSVISYLDRIPTLHFEEIPRWYKQPNYVEVWLEKNAMVSVFESVLEDRHVRIVPNGGWASHTFKNINIKRLKEKAEGSEFTDPQIPHILYFGDYDPSGLRMVEKLRKELAGTGIQVIHAAITKEQIERFGLQRYKNPDPEVLKKLNKDPNAANFRAQNNGELFQIELDALQTLRPEDFRNLILEAVDSLYDEEVYRQMMKHEREIHPYERINELIDEAINEYVESRKSKGESNEDEG